MLLKSYIGVVNDKVTDDNIFNALSYNYGIYGSTPVLLNSSNLIVPVFDKKKIFTVKNMGTIETHEFNGWIIECLS